MIGVCHLSSAWRAARAVAALVRRTGPVGVALVFGFACAGLVLAVYEWSAGWRAIDLQVYQAGARAFLDGTDIYSAHPATSRLPFTYPPFAAVLFVPVGLLGTVPARVVVTGLSMAALLLCVALSVQSVRPTWTVRARLVTALLVAAAALFADPVYWTLAFGQVNLLLAAMVLVDVLAVRPPLPRGVLVGLATAVKLTPGIFVVYLLLTRRTRAAVTAGAVVLGSIAVGFAVAPRSSLLYWTDLVFRPRRVGGVHFVGNQSLRGAVERLTHGGPVASVWWAAAAVVVLLVGLAGAVRAFRQGLELLGAGLCAVTGLLVSPISWNHHWVWALPVAVVLWVRFVEVRTPARLAVAAAWTALFYLAPIWWVPNRNDREYTQHGLQLVAGNAYVLAALLLLAAAPLLLRRPCRSVAVPFGEEPAGDGRPVHERAPA